MLFLALKTKFGPYEAPYTHTTCWLNGYIQFQSQREIKRLYQVIGGGCETAPCEDGTSTDDTTAAIRSVSSLQRAHHPYAALPRRPPTMQQQ